MKYDIGIIGGGQLGMMMVEEAHKLNASCIVLDTNPNACANRVADAIITASFDDIEALKLLGDNSKVLSYEFENVKGSILEKLDNKYNIPQGILPLLDSQDRLREKENALRNGLKTCKFKDFSNILNLSDAYKIIDEIGYPLIYKTRKEGYDGHGQVVINSKDDVSKLIDYLNLEGIIEEKLKFDYECSVVLVRNKNEIINFPISYNIHKDGILDISYTRNDNKEIEDRIIKMSKEFITNANYFGILAIEYFVIGDEIIFNEMAPRPHNSGHYTLEGCQTNQFRELIKFLLDYKLESPIKKHETIMKNILGRDLYNMNKYFNIPYGFIHMYHKDKIKELRKLGHITYINNNIEEFIKKI